MQVIILNNSSLRDTGLNQILSSIGQHIKKTIDYSQEVEMVDKLKTLQRNLSNSSLRNLSDSIDKILD